MIDKHYNNKELANDYLWVCKHLGSKSLTSFKKASYRISAMEVNVAEYFREHGHFKELKISENVCRILKIILENGLEEAVEAAKEENLANYQERVAESQAHAYSVRPHGRSRAGVGKRSDKI